MSKRHGHNHDRAGSCLRLGPQGEPSDPPWGGATLVRGHQAAQVDGITSARHTTVDANHGRLETRHYWITSDIECLGVKGSWANITSVGLVESHRDVGGAVSIEQRFFLTSLPCDA